MIEIKSTLIYGENILIICSDNKLWIMGKNKYRRTGFGIPNKALYMPVYTGIELEQNETVNKFYCYKHLLALYTSTGKLWVSRHAFNDKKISTALGMSLRIDNDDDFEENASGENEYDDENDTDENDTEENEIDSGMYVMDNVSEQEMHVLRGTHQYFIRENRDGTFRVYEQEIEFNTLESSEEDEDSNTLNNYNFIRAMIKQNLKDRKNIMANGFFLVADSIDALTFSETTIFFKKNEKLCVFSSLIESKSAIINKCFGFACVCVEIESNVFYYQLIFPFEYDRISFCEKHVYLSSGQYHYIIVGPSINNDIVGLYCLYFKTNLQINEKEIYYNRRENSMYVKINTTLYKYYHTICDIKEFITNEYTTKIISSNDNIENVLICCKDNKIYLDAGVLVQYKQITKYNYNKFVIDFDIYKNTSVVLINVDSSDCLTFFNKKNTIYINVNSFEYYKLIDTGLLYYDNKTLYYFTYLELFEDEYGIIELDKIVLGTISYYFYMFRDLPREIDDIQFTNNIILIKSGTKYYYYTINTNVEKFVMNKFTEIIVGDNAEDQDLSLVSKHLIVRKKKTFEEEPVTLHINMSANKLDKLLNIIEMLRNKTDFNINFMDGKKHISYGDGPKREFMEEALMIFSEKYLITHQVLSQFNIECMKKFTDDELMCIGSMLHAVICHSVNHLPIRLPLMFISALLKKELTIAELEYFAKLDDTIAFQNLYSIKNSIDDIKYCGFNNYTHALKHLCKYLCEEDNDEISEDSPYTLSQHICKLLATGFKNYAPIRNLDMMNAPTLDYYLSGNYCLDRNLLIRNLKISDNTNGNPLDFRKICVDMIKSLPEDKLTILLKNWSGTSVVKKTCCYEITLKKKKKGDQDVYFATCNTDIIISSKLIEKHDIDLLIDILTTPMTSMNDP